MDPRDTAVRRLLDRYLVEVVERYGLCPWAAGARQAGEVDVRVLWGQPAPAAWSTAARELLARAPVRVAIVVAPEWRGALDAMRDAVTSALPDVGVAAFHPDAPLDLATPARLVSFLRRSPDPMLQVVPLAVLSALRGEAGEPGLAHQAAMLGGHARPRKAPIADRVAAINFETVVRDRAAIEATLADIAADRARSY